MLGRQVTSCAIQYCFPGGEDKNLLFNGFEGSYEEKWVDNKGRVSIVKYGETLFEGDELVRIHWDSLYVMVLWKLSSTCG